MVRVHRVIDAEVNNAEGICYIYTRLEDRSENVVRLRAIYKIIVGSDRQRPTLTTFLSNIQGYHGSNVRISSLGSCDTYYRGSQDLALIECTNYTTYSRILKSVKYDGLGDIYTCRDYSALEDCSLLHYGIYASLYITVDKGTVRPSTSDEEFPYSPRVGSLDFEMLSLNPVRPDCEVYMVAYYDEIISVVIYTSRYLSEDIPDTRDHKYIRVHSKADLMVRLSEVIDASRPDIITGYNIYNADIPLMYFTLRRTMSSWFYSRPGPRPYFHATRKMVKKYIESDAGMSLKIPGTHMVDMYPYLEGILSRDEHKSMKLGDISSHFLKAKKDPLSYKDLDRIYHEGTRKERKVVMKYCVKDALLALELYKHFGVWEFHSAMYSICGISPDRLMSKGMVEITYGMCNNRAIANSVYMDQPNNRIFSPSGGLVIESKAGYYENVYCLDVESMYPNITIQHNIDSSNHIVPERLDTSSARVVQYYRETHDGVSVLLDSGGMSHGFSKSSVAILPSVLRGLLESRKEIKESMKGCKDDDNATRRLRARELALKGSANSGCGASGEQTPGNPMSNCIINDIITTTGRRILTYSQEFFEANGAEVIYGDTDSLFVIYEGDIDHLLSLIHETLPNRIRFKLEYKASKFIMGHKKHYLYRVGNQTKIVGYKGDKASSCKAVQMAFRNLASLVIDEGPEETLLAYEHLVRNCYDEPDLDIGMFSWKISYSGKVYSENSHKYKLIKEMRSRGTEFIPGNSIDVTMVLTEEKYVYKYGRASGMNLPTDGTKKYQIVYSLEEIDGRSDVIDVETIFNSQCRSAILSIVASYVRQN